MNWPSVPRPPGTPPAGNPSTVQLPSGTTLWRVHQPPHPADSFNPNAQPSALAGGRFDSLDGSFSYAYLGDAPSTAIVETVCRDLPLGGAPRLVPRKELTGRCLSKVTIVRDLSVLVLHGAGLTHVGAPLSLTKCDADQYELTRAWAHALRTWFPQVDGFQYRPRHDEDAFAWVLFDDGPSAPCARARGSLACTGPEVDLLAPSFAVELRQVLHKFNATVER